MSPGTSANVWTERSVIQRLGKPYGDCTTNTADKDCFKFCVDDRVAALCDCAWVQRTGLTLCTASTNTQLQCAIDIFDDFLSPSPSCEVCQLRGHMVCSSSVLSFTPICTLCSVLRRCVATSNTLCRTVVKWYGHQTSLLSMSRTNSGPRLKSSAAAYCASTLLLPVRTH